MEGSGGRGRGIRVAHGEGHELVQADLNAVRQGPFDHLLVQGRPAPRFQEPRAEGAETTRWGQTVFSD